MRKLSKKSKILLGVFIIVLGVLIAYITGDTEPWGTIGGFISALGAALILFSFSPIKIQK